MEAQASPQASEIRAATNEAVALELVRKGFKISFADGAKRCIVNGWQRNLFDDATKVREFFKSHQNAVPVIPTGAPNGIAVLDVDKKNNRDGFASLKKLELNLNEEATLLVRTPSGGVHVYFNWEQAIGNANGHLPEGLDVRGGSDSGLPSGYVLAPGAVVEAGEYSTINGELHDVSIGYPPYPEILKAPKRKTAISAARALDVDEVIDALHAIPNDATNPSADSREYWVKIGAALHHCTNGSETGLRAFIEWSSLHESFDADSTIRAWDSFRTEHQKPAGLGTIEYEARKFGWRPDWMLSELDLLPDSAQLKTLSRLRIYSVEDCCEDGASNDYLIKGLIAPGDLFCIFGEPGAGKSLLAPALAYQIASGRNALGLKTKQGSALYVAAEDETGMKRRVGALQSQYGTTDQFKLVGGVSDLYSSNSLDLKELMIEVKKTRPSVVVIDTLAIAFGATDENSAEAMVRVVEVCRLIGKYGAAVIVVHHGTKADGGTPRGHSAFNGALDGSLQLRPRDKSGVIKGYLKKNRRGACDLDIAFKIETVELGRDSDDEVITAPRAEFLSTGGSRPPSLTPSESAALCVLSEQIALGATLSRADWRELCKAESAGVSSASKADSRRRAAENAINGLLTKGYVTVATDGAIAKNDTLASAT